MVEIPDPTRNVVTVVDDVEQPKPTTPRIGTCDDLVAVETPCPVCGCQWLLDPEAFIPKGTAECGFCNTMRGAVHRDVSLIEFEDGKPVEDTNKTIQFRFAGSPPGPDFETLATGARVAVRHDPTLDFMSVLVDHLGSVTPFLASKQIQALAHATSEET